MTKKDLIKSVEHLNDDDDVFLDIPFVGDFGDFVVRKRLVSRYKKETKLKCLNIKEKELNPTNPKIYTEDDIKEDEWVYNEGYFDDFHKENSDEKEITVLTAIKQNKLTGDRLGDIHY